jgi:hypothetical protein
VGLRTSLGTWGKAEGYNFTRPIGTIYSNLRLFNIYIYIYIEISKPFSMLQI